MRRLVISLVILLAALLGGCATTDVLTGEPLVTATGQQIEPLVALANNGLIAAVLDDAAATTAWVDAQEKAGMEPLKVALARACPTAAKAAATDFHAKVLALKALLEEAGKDIGAIDIERPRLILRLTELKYGTPLDIQSRMAQVRADIALRLDAIWTGCSHLFPKKQAVDLLKLAGKAGVLSTGVGGLAGLLVP